MYRFFEPSNAPFDADYLIAGDGVYRVMDCFGLRVPVPLIAAQIRGLPKLLPWLHGNRVACSPVGDFGPSYHILTADQPTVPPIERSRVYQYVIGHQGVFLLAGCSGLEMLLPISLPVLLPCLAPVTPFIRSSYPPVPKALMQEILRSAKAAHNDVGHPIERLFYLLWEGQWRLHEPEQEASWAHVRARQVTDEYLAAFIEGHSHHGMAAYFSGSDDQAEVQDGGFRVYFVLGRIFTQPQLRVRICVHGYAWEVAASTFFELPAEIVDAVAKEALCEI